MQTTRTRTAWPTPRRFRLAVACSLAVSLLAVGVIHGPAQAVKKSTTTKPKTAKPKATKPKATTPKVPKVTAKTVQATTRPATTISPSTVAATQAPVTVRSKKLVVYSGRAERLVKPLLDTFSFETGIELEVRYADSSQLAATLLEEGDRTKADVFFSQDAGALGALNKKGRLAQLPSNVLAKVAKDYQADNGSWVGVSGRARVFVFDPRQVQNAPDKIDDLLDPKWKGKLAYAPTNASWHSFVTGLRQSRGEAAAKTWLQGFKANNPRSYSSNALVVQGVEKGDVAIGLVNHYYLYELAGGDLRKVKSRNEFAAPGDPGALVNVAGAAVLKEAGNDSAAFELVSYLLTKDAQTYFATKTYEYPLISTVSAAPELPPLASLKSPVADLSDLDSIDESLKLLRDVGLL
jgi:iron(III) transport system substrate-binding protein